MTQGNDSPNAPNNSGGRKATKHIAILGRFSSGKTTLATSISHDILRENQWIEKWYSNSIQYAGDYLEGLSPRDASGNRQLHAKYVPLETIEDLFTARKALILIDEFSKILPARMWHSDYNSIVSRLAGNLGKQDCFLIYTDQYVKGVDVVIRNNVSEVHTPFVKTDSQGLPLMDEQLAYGMTQETNPDFTNYVTSNMVNYGLVPGPIRNIFDHFESKQIIPLPLHRTLAPKDWNDTANSFLVFLSAHGVKPKVYTVYDREIKDWLERWLIERNMLLGQSEMPTLRTYLNSSSFFVTKEDTKSVKVWECKDCGKKFASEYNLTQHRTAAENRRIDKEKREKKKNA